MERRTDRLTELFIDATLHTCLTHGDEAAAQILDEQGVAKATIDRILVEQRRRRAPCRNPGYLHWLFG